MQDGGFIEIPKGTVLEKPIYLMFVSTADGMERLRPHVHETFTFFRIKDFANPYR